MTSGNKSLSVASETSPKNQVFEKLSQIASSFNSPGRLKILTLLSQGPKSVEKISVLSGQSFANTSQHLQRMVREGLVQCAKEGVSRIYRVRSNRVLELWELFQDVAHELSPDLDLLENKITDRSLLPAKSLEAVRKDLRSGKATLLDVREEDEAIATPLLNAVNIPLSTIQSRLKGLSSKKTIYIFCRGRYCPKATEVVRLLRAKGYECYRLRESPFRLHSILRGNTK